MSQVRKGSVRLTALQPVEHEDVTIPPGTYIGQSSETALPSLAGLSWTKPVYSIEFTAEQLDAMGIKSRSRDLISMSLDVTKFVRSGQITRAP